MTCVYELPYDKHKLLFDTWIAHSLSLLGEQKIRLLILDVGKIFKSTTMETGRVETNTKCVNNEVFTFTCLTVCIFLQPSLDP